MNVNICLNWPQVSEADFLSVVETMDYRRDAWANAIIYRDARNLKQTIGFIVSDKYYHLHPALAEEL